MKIHSNNHPSKILIKQPLIRKQTSVKHRNDHSIQAKSPMRISMSTNSLANKTDLTFRIKNEVDLTPSKPLQKQNKSFFNETRVNENYGEKTNGSLSQKFNKSIKINIKALTQAINIARLSPKQKMLISDAQCSLIDKLWEVCTKLCTFRNQYIQDNLNAIQYQIKKMLCIIAQQNVLEDAPLSSSKKIKLQNCIAQSHCEKQVHHKEFGSDQEQQEQISSLFQNSLQNSQKTIKTQSLQHQKIEQYKKSENHDQLQMKKIMYMLDHKNVQNSQKSSFNSSKTNSRFRYQGNASQRIKSQKYQQLSSFNQNSCDDSGYTVFQIQRCTQRLTDGSSKKSQSTNIKENREQKKVSFFKKRQSQHSQRRNNQIKIESQTYQTCSQSDNIMESQASVNIGNKRKVLNDIVAMLNHKYNKNIRLQ